MKGSNEHFSIKQQFYVICFLTLLSIISIIVVDVQIDRSQERLDQASNERFRAHQLAQEFKRTIDDLHNMLQNYVTFGSPEFSQKHNEVIRIVSGNLPRPQNYNQIYRGRPSDSEFEELQLDPTKSLLYHIKNSGIPEADLAPILGVTGEYGKMLALQSEIIEIAEEDQQDAINMLSSDDYTSLKDTVMEPLTNFIGFQERKYQKIIFKITDEQEDYKKIQIFLLLLIGLFILSVIMLVNRYVINPIVVLAEQLKEVAFEDSNTSKQSLSELVSKTKTVINELKSKTTEQFQTEQKLISTIKQLRDNNQTDINNISDNKFGSWSVELNEYKVHWSNSTFHIYGFPTDGSVKASREAFISIVHPDDKERFIVAIKDTLENGKPYDIEHRIITPAGDVKHISTRGDTLHDENGIATFMHGTVVDVTERVLAEQEIKKAENLLLEAQQIAKLGNYIWYYKTGKIELSKMGCEIYEIDPNNPIIDANLISRITHPDDISPMRKTFNEAVKNKTPFNLDRRILLKSGKIRHVNSGGKIYFDKNGDIDFIRGTMLDITERVETEQKVQNSEARLIVAQRISHMGNWHADFIQGIYFWSDEFFHILGLEPQEFTPLKDSFHQFVHPDDLDHLTSNVNDALEKREDYNVDYRIIRPDGNIRHVHAEGEVRYGQDGNPATMQGIIQDITEQVLNTKEKERIQSRLIEAQRISHIGSWNHDMVNDVLYWSDEVYRIIGHEAQEFKPTYNDFIECLHPEDKDFVEAAVQSALEKKEKYNIEHRIIRKDGVIRYINAQGEVTFSNDGSPISIDGTMHDITERKRIEEERVLALGEAQEANKAKSQFLATMSHELRTPLNAIIGFSEMMTNKIFGELGSDKYTEYAGDIVGSSRHLLNLVNDILDLSEIESGGKKMDINNISLKDAIDECQFIITKLAEDKNITCSFKIPDDMTMIYADERSLKQIIINIMNNSVKFTPNNGKISLEAFTKNNQHIITVEDNGEGIPEGKIGTVLDPFVKGGVKSSHMAA